MYQGTTTLEDFGIELARRRSAARDFIVPTGRMELSSDGDNGGRIEIELPGGNEGFAVNEQFHRQLSHKLGIPAKHYRRLQTDHPDILDAEVNALLQREPEKRMVRTLDGCARAFLSDRYRAIDNYQVAEAVFPVLAENAEMQIASHAITDDRMYLKAIFPNIQHEIKKGDILRFGLLIENSEVGLGSLMLSAFIDRLICTNGMAMSSTFRRAHLGRKQGDDDDGANEWLRDETRAADDKVLGMKLADCIRGAMTDGFSKSIAAIESAASETIEKPAEAVEEITNRFGLIEDEASSVMKHLIAGGDVTRWGLANAVTRASQDTPDGNYDRATDLEKFGGRIVEMPKREWAAVVASN